jgi:hypothetical protein
LNWIAGRGKGEADIASTMSDTARDWIHELAEERKTQNATIAALRHEVHECERRHDDVANELYRLVSWLRDRGLDYPGEHER